MGGQGKKMRLKNSEIGFYGREKLFCRVIKLVAIVFCEFLGEH